MTKMDITWGCGAPQEGLPLGEILDTRREVVKMPFSQAASQTNPCFVSLLPHAVGVFNEAVQNSSGAVGDYSMLATANAKRRGQMCAKMPATL
jgi:hypothetical protein